MKRQIWLTEDERDILCMAINALNVRLRDNALMSSVQRGAANFVVGRAEAIEERLKSLDYSVEG